MNPTLFEISIAIVMVAVGFALVVSFVRYCEARSAIRMLHMLGHAGVDPEVVVDDSSQPVIQDARKRCGACPSEDLCDRWLAGKLKGDSSFCPNTPILRMLRAGAKRVMS